MQATDFRIQRTDQGVPALLAEDERQQGCDEIQHHIAPARLLQALPKRLPVHSPEGKPDEYACQDERQGIFDDICGFLGHRPQIYD